MKLITVSLSLLMLTSCIHMKEWEKKDQNLAKVMIAGQAGDTATTIIGKEQGLKELNSLAPESDIGLIAFKAGGTYGLLWVADKVPWIRRPILWVGSIFGWGAAAWNISKMD